MKKIFYCTILSALLATGPLAQASIINKLPVASYLKGDDKKKKKKSCEGTSKEHCKKGNKSCGSSSKEAPAGQ
jgi:hypothetical protein